VIRPNSKLGPILHRLATVHARQTDDNYDKASTLSLQLSGRPKNSSERCKIEFRPNICTKNFEYSVLQKKKLSA